MERRVIGAIAAHLRTDQDCLFFVWSLHSVYQQTRKLDRLFVSLSLDESIRTAFNNVLSGLSIPQSWVFLIQPTKKLSFSITS
jgi:hypothetical protein